MALIPLVWLVVRTEHRSRYWWVAAAFAVSWIADSAAHSVNPWLVSLLFPIGQAGLIVVAFAEERREAQIYIGLMMVAGLLSLAWEGTKGPDLFLPTVAAGTALSVIWPMTDRRLRACLLVAFGGGLLTWTAYAIVPGWTTWAIYQSVRALSLGLFCWATLSPQPRVRAIA